MKKWLKRYKAWCARRELRSLERWKQIRAKGKRRFVVNTALTYGFTVVGATHFFENLFYGPYSISLARLIYYLLMGIPIGLFGWSSMEAKYQKALREASSGSKTLPPGETKQFPFS